MKNILNDVVFLTSLYLSDSESYLGERGEKLDMIKSKYSRRSLLLSHILFLMAINETDRKRRDDIFQ